MKNIIVVQTKLSNKSIFVPWLMKTSLRVSVHPNTAFRVDQDGTVVEDSME